MTGELARADRSLRFLPTPSPDQAELLIPLDMPRAARHVSRSFASEGTATKVARNSIAGILLSRGIVPPGRAIFTVGVRAHPESRPRLLTPFLVAQAAELGVTDATEFWVYLGEVSRRDAPRGAFYLFEPGSSEPGHIIKFGRVPGAGSQFDHEAAATRMAHAAGPAVARRLPELLGRIDVNGFPASVETAAHGRRFDRLLSSSRSRRSSKLTLVDQVVRWLEDVAGHTAGGDLSGWTSFHELGAITAHDAGLASLVNVLDEVPGVLFHGDLYPMNVIGGRGDFTVIDWEGGEACGPPLWDLWTFLDTALPLIEGASTTAEEDELRLRLFAGGAPLSSVLFDATRRVAAASGVPAEAVGRLAALLWLHDGYVEANRVAELRNDDALDPALAEGFARRWLATHGLGSTWERWRS